MAKDKKGKGRGHYQGRGGGGGRGGGKGGSKSTSSTANQPKLMQFAPNTQGKSQTATYASVKDAIIQQILKTFKDGEDVAKSIEDGTEVVLDEPEREISKKEVAAEAALEQSGLDIKYQEELRGYLERKNNLRQGMVKAYALILSNYCTKAMVSKVEEHPEFDSIKNKPI